MNAYALARPGSGLDAIRIGHASTVADVLDRMPERLTACKCEQRIETLGGVLDPAGTPDSCPRGATIPRALPRPTRPRRRRTSGSAPPANRPRAWAARAA